MDSKKQISLSILSMAGFVALWAVVTDAWNYSTALFPNIETGKYLYGYLSRMIWMFPAFILIFKFGNNLCWNIRQLFSKPKPEPVFLSFVILTTWYALMSMLIKYRSWHLTDESILLLSIKMAIVGIGEETVFRGWGYNLLKKVKSDTFSLFISALMFVILHWPAYFIKLFLNRGFSWMAFTSQSISAFICGLLFGIMLKRSKTLWNPIVAHCWYDLALNIFV